MDSSFKIPLETTVQLDKGIPNVMTPQHLQLNGLTVGDVGYFILNNTLVVGEVVGVDFTYVTLAHPHSLILMPQSAGRVQIRMLPFASDAMFAPRPQRSFRVDHIVQGEKCSGALEKQYRAQRSGLVPAKEVSK